MNDVEQLQQILLEAVVSGRPLPGGVAVSYPDAPFLGRPDVSLRFAPPEIEEDRVRLTLHGTIGNAPLSTVQVTFRRTGDEWRADPPVYSAA